MLDGERHAAWAVGVDDKTQDDPQRSVAEQRKIRSLPPQVVTQAPPAGPTVFATEQIGEPADRRSEGPILHPSAQHE